MPKVPFSTTLKIIARNGAAPVVLPRLEVKLRGNRLQIDRQQLTAVIQAVLDSAMGASSRSRTGKRSDDHQG